MATNAEEQGDGPAGVSAGDLPVGEAEAETSAMKRVIFFSDAVVAIAITLLALDLPVPHTTAATTNAEFWRALREHRAEYGAFLVSFAVIGNHWATHRRIFRYAGRLDHRIDRLNMLWLLMMVVTPVATRMLSAANGAIGVRFTIYALIQVIASTCLLLMGRELARRELLRPDAPESVRHRDDAPALALIVVFLASIPVVFVTPWAFALWGMTPLATRALRRVRNSSAVPRE